jgi:head-tail adaptor
MIDRKWTRASKNERSQAGEIEQDDLVSYWAELRTAFADLRELHGEEAIRQMDSEQRC